MKGMYQQYVDVKYKSVYNKKVCIIIMKGKKCRVKGMMKSLVSHAEKKKKKIFSLFGNIESRKKNK